MTAPRDCIGLDPAGMAAALSDNDRDAEFGPSGPTREQLVRISDLAAADEGLWDARQRAVGAAADQVVAEAYAGRAAAAVAGIDWRLLVRQRSQLDAILGRLCDENDDPERIEALEGVLNLLYAMTDGIPAEQGPAPPDRPAGAPGPPRPGLCIELDPAAIHEALLAREDLRAAFGPAGPTREQLERIGEAICEADAIWAAFDTALRCAADEVLAEACASHPGPGRGEGPLR